MNIPVLNVNQTNLHLMIPAQIFCNLAELFALLRFIHVTCVYSIVTHYRYGNGNINRGGAAYAASW